MLVDGFMAALLADVLDLDTVVRRGIIVGRIASSRTRSLRRREEKATTFQAGTVCRAQGSTCNCTTTAIVNI